VRLDREAGKDIWGVEGKIHKKLVLAAPDLNKKMRMEVDALAMLQKGCYL